MNRRLSDRIKLQRVLSDLILLCVCVLCMFCIRMIAHADENQDYYRDGPFELPVDGSSGYASIALDMTDQSGAFSIREIGPGTGFTILNESDGRLEISVDGETGFVPEQYVMINLPDIIPSIVYKDTNADASQFQASGADLPGITGSQLYEAYYKNDRLGQEQYVMPVLYPMALKIMEAQKMCRKRGETLVLYESYRPHDVQMEVASSLRSLAGSNAAVSRGLNQSGYNLGWFIATSRSNHQLGVAIDVSLAYADSWELHATGPWLYRTVTEYTECWMPCPVHELSVQATTFASPVSSSNDNDWRYAALSPTMTDSAIELQQICTDAGMSPLSSEWWHFNDLQTRQAIRGHESSGGFRLDGCYSRAPEDSPALISGLGA